MLSDNIRNYRKENNMSQDELAEKLGVPIAFAEGEGADFVAKVFGVEPFA